MATYNGTAGDDSQFFGATADKMYGLAGDDTLGGGAGKDTIDGGDGNDILIGGGNDGAIDVLRGGDGADFLGVWFGDKLDGGEGVDIGQFNMTALTQAVTVEVDAEAGDGDVTGTIGGVGQTKSTFTAMEAVFILTGSGADIVTLTGIAGQATTGDGDDTVWGGSGNDYLRGQNGDDRLDGGAGYDRAAYVGAASGVTVNLKLQGQLQNTGGAGKDFLTGIEAVSGTQFNDKLTGDNLGNWLWGQNGNDTLTGGDGADLLSVGVGNHKLYGDAGLDIVSFWGHGAFTSGVTCNLNIGTAQNTGQGSMTLKSIERLSGTAFDDVFTGTKDNNDLTGDIGSDLIKGGGGSDFIAGDAAIDAAASPGNLSGVPIFIPIRPGIDFADPNLHFKDTLDGGDGADTLQGGAFGDSLTGGKGADTFLYWSHRESLAFDKDVILDLKDSEDTIDLATVDADANLDGDQAFVLVDAFSNTAGEIKLTWVKESNFTLLEMDVTGDGVADGVIQINGRHDGFENFVL